jgi:hypothetical protein
MVSKCISCGVWTDFGLKCTNCTIDPLDEHYNKPSENDQNVDGDFEDSSSEDLD